MNTKENKKSNRRGFFAVAGSSVLVATIIKAVPFSGLFAKTKKSDDKVKVRIHPKAVQRNNRGLS